MSTHDQYRPEWACLNVPPLAGAAVRRHSLLDVLSDIRCRVVWIAAPPGYGKTSLLAQHADLTKARGEAVSWLSVEQSDADAHRLAANLSLSLALSNTAPRAAEGWRASEPELLLTEALAAVAASAQPQTLYLDDCHLAADAPALALIGTLLRRAPANLR